MKKLPAQHKHFLSNKLVIWTISFALIGVATLLMSHAATPASVIEPEDAAITGNAQSITDATASNGKALQFLATATTGDGIWQQIAPPQISADFNNPSNNYGFNSIVIDPTNSSVLFMGTNYQGLWKSTDKGVTWAKISTGTGANLLDQGRLWTLAIDPFNHTNLWTTSGYGAGGPLKSTDGGMSWVKIPVGPPTQNDDVYSIFFDPYTPNHLIMAWHSVWSTDGTNSGVTETTNGGASWINHPAPSGSNWAAGNAAWFLDDSHTWLLGSQNGGIWRTTDSGTTWTKLSSENITHGGVNSLVKYGGTYYLAHTSTIAKSTDNGATWTTISSGLPTSYFSMVATDGTNLYTAPSFPAGSTFDSANGPWYYQPLSGGSWQSLTNSPNTCYNYSGTGHCNGPVMAAYDSTNHIGYTVNWLGGVWKIAH